MCRRRRRDEVATAVGPELLRRTFGLDVFECPTCKGRMKLDWVVSRIEQDDAYVA
jgi:hypothetical protein